MDFVLVVGVYGFAKWAFSRSAEMTEGKEEIQEVQKQEIQKPVQKEIEMNIAPRRKRRALPKESAPEVNTNVETDEFPPDHPDIMQQLANILCYAEAMDNAKKWRKTVSKTL